MQNENDAIIELGAASIETRGDNGSAVDHFITRLPVGISEDD
jgi:hypothetical protein